MKKKIILGLIFVSFISQSKDFGVYGELFSIDEADLLSVIENRLAEVEREGTFDALKKNLQEQATRNRDRPISVLSEKAQETRSWIFDPTITVNKELSDNKGNVFARPGDKFNPLNYVVLSKSLFFIDADDEKQISWLKNQNLALTDKIILTNGSTLDASKAFNRRVFFDQNGELIKRFGITKVPSWIKQKNNQLVITEVYLND